MVFSRYFFFFLAFALIAICLPEAAFAQRGGAGLGGQSTIASSLCDVINMITGPAGRAIASLAVIVVGASSLLGRVQWNQAIIVCVGIAVIFGAPELLQEMTGENAPNCQQIAPHTPAPMLDGPVAQTLCNVVGFFSGRVGHALATIGIIIMGLMALMGKLAPPYALMVAAGIALIIGSASIVRDLAPDNVFNNQVNAQSSCRPLIET